PPPLADHTSLRSPRPRPKTLRQTPQPREGRRGLSPRRPLHLLHGHRVRPPRGRIEALLLVHSQLGPVAHRVMLSEPACVSRSLPDSCRDPPPTVAKHKGRTAARSNPEDTLPRKPAPRDVVTLDELMTAYEVADVLGLAAGTLANWRTLGLG